MQSQHLMHCKKKKRESKKKSFFPALRPVRPLSNPQLRLPLSYAWGLFQFNTLQMDILIIIESIVMRPDESEHSP